MLTVASVLKSGGEYTPEHVRRLRNGFARHLTIPHRFVCLTDVPTPDYECAALRHGWRGWWSKLELFRPDVFQGAVLFADLDTIITGPLDDMALGHRFTVLESFWSPSRIGSGLMAWDCDLSSIYHKFAEEPARYMAEYVTKAKWGDQGFIRYNWPHEPERWQAKHPGRVVSYKFHCKTGVPPGASIVCYHGKPRPWQTPLWGAL